LPLLHKRLQLSAETEDALVLLVLTDNVEHVVEDVSDARDFNFLAGANGRTCILVAVHLGVELLVHHLLHVVLHLMHLDLVCLNDRLQLVQLCALHWILVA